MLWGGSVYTNIAQNCLLSTDINSRLFQKRPPSFSHATHPPFCSHQKTVRCTFTTYCAGFLLKLNHRKKFKRAEDKKGVPLLQTTIILQAETRLSNRALHRLKSDSPLP